MKLFDAPVSKFRDMIRMVGDQPFGFTHGNQVINISSRKTENITL